MRVLLARLRPLRLALALAPLLALSGCFQMRALLRLAADGSGTIEETVGLSEAMRGFLAMADTTGQPLTLHVLDSLHAHAAELGPGVRFVRVDTFSDGAAFGYRALYAFDDVNALRYRFAQNPITLPGQPAGARPDGGDNAFFPASDPENPVTFAFAPGRLTVRMSHPEASPDARAADLDPAAVAALTDSLRRHQAQGAAMARQMLGDARVALAVALPGRVTETDAAHAADSTLTLTDFTMGAVFDVLAEKPELAARAQLLERQGTPDPRPVLRALAARPGVRYELQPEVTVEWE